MKSRSYFKTAFFSSADPKQIEEQLNEALKKLAECHPSFDVDISGSVFSAVVKWTVTEQEPETIADEYRLAGERYYCYDCPLHDIETNRTRKRVSCDYAELGMTRLDSEACDYFYKQLKIGKISPIDPGDHIPKPNTIKGTVR